MLSCTLSLSSDVGREIARLNCFVIEFLHVHTCGTVVYTFEDLRLCSAHIVFPGSLCYVEQIVFQGPVIIRTIFLALLHVYTNSKVAVSSSLLFFNYCNNLLQF